MQMMNGWTQNSSGVFSDTKCGSKTTDHQIAAVGYGTTNADVNFWVQA